MHKHRNCGGVILAHRLFDHNKWHWTCYQCCSCGLKWFSRSEMEADLEPDAEANASAAWKKLTRLPPGSIDNAVVGGFLMLQLIDSANVVSDQRLWELNCRLIDASVALYMAQFPDEERAIDRIGAILDELDFPVIRRLTDIARRLGLEGM